MWIIFKKEVQTFFSSLMAYVVIGFYLVVTGMMLWVFPDYSILEFPYASLEPYFNLAPYLLAMLIPAITMRSFAEEIQQGTFELLLTKPITLHQLIGGKYLANLFLVLLTILPSLVYYFSLKSLAASPSSWPTRWGMPHTETARPTSPSSMKMMRYWMTPISSYERTSTPRLYSSVTFAACPGATASRSSSLLKRLLTWNARPVLRPAR